MRLLLDTHALIWWFAGDLKLVEPARNAIEDDSNTVVVSAASAWEVATKFRIGRLPDVAELVYNISGYLANQEFEPLPVTVEHGIRAGSLPGPFRDPFDRMLIAQALTENLVLVSIETLFDHYGVRRLW